MREYLFLQNKIKRQIDWNGQNFKFNHTVEDKYHRGTSSIVISVKGVYHQATAYQQKETSAGVVTSRKPKPMVLALYTDGSQVSVGDTVKINDKDMIVTGIEDVQELNVAVEISLEVNE